MKYKNFLITGAASGLGKCMTQQLLDAGKKVIALDINDLNIEEFNQNENLKFIKFDLKNYSEIDNIIDNLNDIKNVDCLVNSAGYEAAGFIDELPIDEIIRNFNVNTIAPIKLSQKLLPILKKNQGCIVNLISAMATIAVPGRLPYCMSKSALQMFSNILRCEYKYHNINVLTVYPEVMETPFWQKIVYFGRIKSEAINDPRKKRDPNIVATEVIKSISKQKSFFWRFSFTNYFAIFYTIFTQIGDKIVDVICKIKDSNITPKNH